MEIERMDVRVDHNTAHPLNERSEDNVKNLIERERYIKRRLKQLTSTTMRFWKKPSGKLKLSFKTAIIAGF